MNTLIELVDKRHIVIRTTAGFQMEAKNLHFQTEEDARFELGSYLDSIEGEIRCVAKDAYEVLSNGSKKLAEPNFGRFTGGRC